MRLTLVHKRQPLPPLDTLEGILAVAPEGILAAVVTVVFGCLLTASCLQ